VSTLLLLLAGLVLLLGGGDLLVRGASALARALGIPPIVIGLTVVAFGTSAPELVVNLIAVAGESPGIAFGNVVGSNLANLGLILGIAAIVRPMKVQGTVIVREIPMMLLATAFVLAMSAEPDLGGVRGSIERTEGICLLLLFAVFLYALFAEMVRHRASDPLALQVESSQATRAPSSPWLSGGMIAGGLLGLGIGGHLLVQSASRLALAIGVPEVVVGLSVVAVGTSLPELVTSLIAALRDEADMAIGNVVGSNIFNLLLILGITTSVTPVTVPEGGFLDLVVLLILSASLLPMAFTHVRRLVRGEGLLLLASWAAYTLWRALLSG
jgi:cation:H+ antiporter